MLLPERPGTMSPAGVADAHEWPHPSRPWVRGVMVSTADGSARSPKGRSGGISSAADRLVFATIRGLSDVVLVGAETVRKEGYGPPKPRPELADRRARNGQAEATRMAVVTRSGKLDPTSSLFADADADDPPIVFAPKSIADEQREALAPVCDLRLLGDDEVDLAAAVGVLADLELNRIACEGGPSLLGQIASVGLLNELCLTVTPLLFGGSYEGLQAPRVLAGPALPNPPQPVELAHLIESDGSLFLRYVVPE